MKGGDGTEIKLVDNTGEILESVHRASVIALESCGLTAEGYAKTNLTNNGSVDTGRLRNSITHIVDQSELSVTVGTNVEYASYVCLGTGKYYPGGRPKPWPYQDAKGNWHWTAGNPAKPFLKPAIADHADVYRKIIKDALSNV